MENATPPHYICYPLASNIRHHTSRRRPAVFTRHSTGSKSKKGTERGRDEEADAIGNSFLQFWYVWNPPSPLPNDTLAVF